MTAGAILFVTCVSGQSCLTCTCVHRENKCRCVLFVYMFVRLCLYVSVSLSVPISVSTCMQGCISVCMLVCSYRSTLFNNYSQTFTRFIRQLHSLRNGQQKFVQFSLSCHAVVHLKNNTEHVDKNGKHKYLKANLRKLC